MKNSETPWGKPLPEQVGWCMSEIERLKNGRGKSNVGMWIFIVVIVILLATIVYIFWLSEHGWTFLIPEAMK